MLDPLEALTEAGELAEEVKRLLKEFDRGRPAEGCCATSVRPDLDLIEREHAFEIIMDLPGVDADSLKIVVRRDVAILAGEKRPPSLGGLQNARFHRVERSFGRFARIVRFPAGVDGAATTALLQKGELRLTVPKAARREVTIAID